jgi:hypothetical protein
MKSIVLFATVCLVAFTACGQNDKSKRASPPAVATGTTASGTAITINYSQPSVKGRTIGKDLEPLPGQVWRTGANEATVFEVNKDVKVEGQALPAGKYGLYSLATGDDWVIIFNKTWKQWGTEYSQATDALRVKVKAGKAASFAEKFTITVSKDGQVHLLWGAYDVPFKVE